MAPMARRLLSLLVAGLLLAGCSIFGNSDESGQTRDKLAQITDIPLPKGYDVDNGNTIIFGEGERLSGKLVYTINSGADDMFDFYRREMPKLGWSEISVFRAPTSVMTYSRGSRVTTIQIAPRTLFGSSVQMVVAPATGSGAAAATAPGTLRPEDMQAAPPAAPRRDVTSQPLK